MIETKHFKKEELACPCCGKAKFPVFFLKHLEELRVKFGKPMVVRFCCACDEYHKVSAIDKMTFHSINAQFNGEDEKYTGTIAIQISTANMSKLEQLQLIVYAYELGWTVGIHSEFVYLDLRSIFSEQEKTIFEVD